MKLLKWIFRKLDSNSVERDSNSVESLTSLNKTKSPFKESVKKYKTVDASGIIYASTVFSHGWDESPEILETNSSMILDVIKNNQDELEQLNYWNKLYYDNITHHYLINQNQLERISSVINVDKKHFRSLYKYWPKKLSKKDYNQIFKLLKLKFVHQRSIKEEDKGKYLIRINESFWDIETHDGKLLTDIINTHEREFQDFELIHETYEAAISYGVIIADRLCNERGPDNPYYYKEKLKAQLLQLSKEQLSDLGIGAKVEIPSFEFNSLRYEGKELKSKYYVILLEKEKEIKAMRQVIELIDEIPFEIIKIKST